MSDRDDEFVLTLCLPALERMRWTIGGNWPEDADHRRAAFPTNASVSSAGSCADDDVEIGRDSIMVEAPGVAPELRIETVTRFACLARCSGRYWPLPRRPSVLRR